MPKIKVNDINVYYEMLGQGFPLVMIAGLGGNLDYWDPRLVDALSKRFKLLLFDNRGAGRTDVSERSYSIKLFADDTAGLMDALGIRRAHIFGLSMGGMIAQELALNHPEKVEKLVLCSTSCGGVNAIKPQLEPPRFLPERSALSPAEMARNTIRFVFTEEFIKDNPELVELSIQRMSRAPISDEAFMRQMKAIMEFDTYDRLPQIKAPTLILHGKKDVVIPAENALILAKRIPNAKLVYLEKSAHGLVDEMEKLVSVLLDFLT